MIFIIIKDFYYKIWFNYAGSFFFFRSPQNLQTAQTNRWSCPLELMVVAVVEYRFNSFLKKFVFGQLLVDQAEVGRWRGWLRVLVASRRVWFSCPHCRWLAILPSWGTEHQYWLSFLRDAQPITRGRVYRCPQWNLWTFWRIFLWLLLNQSAWFILDLDQSLDYS